MRTVVEAIASHGEAVGSLTVLDSATPSLGNRVSLRNRVSWRDIHHRARRISHLLRQHGVTRGSRVGLLGETSVDLVAALQGIWLAGAAVTVLPPAGRRGRHAHAATVNRIINDARLTLVLTDAEADTGAGVPLDVEMPLDATVLPLRAALGPMADITYPDPGDLAILQYTSGSTSDPRGILVTHAHLMANLEAIESAFDHGGGHPVRMMSWLPLYHDMGLIGFLSLPMARGWDLVVQPPHGFATRPAGWFEAIDRHRITVTGGPNFAFHVMTKLLNAGLTADLSTLRFLLCGGEPIDGEAIARFTEAAAVCGLDPGAITPAYGLAEATLAVSISPPGTGLRVDIVDPVSLDRYGYAEPAADGVPARRLVRLGPAVSGIRMRVVDQRTRRPLPDRYVGQIEVCGASVTGPPGTWLDTGDLGYLADGELVVCGRQKDVLFAAGRNVHPQDVEAAVARLRGVRPGAVAAFGIPGVEGDRLVVAVETRRTDLRTAVAAAVSTAVGLKPAEVITLAPGQIPKTSSGKVRRSETRRRYVSGELLTGRTVQ